MRLLPIAFAAGMASIDAVALSLMKKVSLKSLSPFYVIGSMMLYALQPLLIWKALSYESMIVVNFLWDIVSDILVTLVGVFYFGEVLGYRKWLGVALGIVAMYFITCDDGEVACV
jgi:drug/metabolite transporter (DMT)-like permease